MGCGGGYHGLFRLVDSYGHSRRGYGRNRETHYDYYQSDDREEKITLIKNMYAAGLINDEEYQNYKERVYDSSISFDELVSIKRRKTSGEHERVKEKETVSNFTESYSKYSVKLRKLKESKEKITKVQDKLLSNIKDLEKEKERMESLAETMLKSKEETAVKYINKKIDLEENIQNLIRRKKELEVQVAEVDGVIKNLEAKEIELEAIKLQKELDNIKLED